MTAEEHDTLMQSLADLQRQIGDKSREFETRGEFAELRDAFVADLKARQAAIIRRIDAALTQGFSWRLIRTEFERDFDGIFGELLRWEKRLDAATMVRDPAGQSPA